MEIESEQEVFRPYKDFCRLYRGSIERILVGTSFIEEVAMFEMALRYEGPVIDELWVYGVRVMGLWEQAMDVSSITQDLDKRRKYLASLPLYNSVGVKHGANRDVKILLRRRPNMFAEIIKEAKGLLEECLPSDPERVFAEIEEDDSALPLEVIDQTEKAIINFVETAKIRTDYLTSKIDFCSYLHAMGEYYPTVSIADTMRYDFAGFMSVATSVIFDVPVDANGATHLRPIADAPDDVDFTAQCGFEHDDTFYARLYVKMSEYYGPNDLGKGILYCGNANEYRIGERRMPLGRDPEKYPYGYRVTNMVKTDFPDSMYTSVSPAPMGRGSNWASLTVTKFLPDDYDHYATASYALISFGVSSPYVHKNSKRIYDASALLTRMKNSRKYENYLEDNEATKIDSMVSGFLSYGSFGGDFLPEKDYIAAYEKVVEACEKVTPLTGIGPEMAGHEGYVEEHLFGQLEALKYVESVLRPTVDKVHVIASGSVNPYLEEHWNAYFPDLAPPIYKHYMHAKFTDDQVTIEKNGGYAVLIGGPFPDREPDKLNPRNCAFASNFYNFHSIRSLFTFYSRLQNRNAHYIVTLQAPFGAAFAQVQRFVTQGGFGFKLIECSSENSTVMVCLGPKRYYPPVHGELYYMFSNCSAIGGFLETNYCDYHAWHGSLEELFPCWKEGDRINRGVFADYNMAFKANRHRIDMLDMLYSKRYGPGGDFVEDRPRRFQQQ